MANLKHITNCAPNPFAAGAWRKRWILPAVVAAIATGGIVSQPIAPQRAQAQTLSQAPAPDTPPPGPARPPGAAVFGQTEFGFAVLDEQAASNSFTYVADGQLLMQWANVLQAQKTTTDLPPNLADDGTRPPSTDGTDPTDPTAPSLSWVVPTTVGGVPLGEGFGGPFSPTPASITPFFTPGTPLSATIQQQPQSQQQQQFRQPTDLPQSTAVPPPPPRPRPSDVPDYPNRPLRTPGSSTSTFSSFSAPPVGLAALPTQPFDPNAPSAPSSHLGQALEILRTTGRPPQFVQLAFDGSLSLEMWQNSLGFAQQVPVRFTYFVSCVYFLDESTKDSYRSPHNSRLGRSAIGFGDDPQGIGRRLAYLQQAHAQGHEIGSHGCGHFDGTTWNQDQWQFEFEQFRAAMANAYDINAIPGKPSGWEHFITQQVRGFRAPLLGSNRHLFRTLEHNGFRYDTSRVGRSTDWPTRRSGDFWDFPLASIREPSSGKNILAMDYNFYLSHSGAKPQKARAREFEERMLEAYLTYFDQNYHGNRAPLHIGHHFSRWNDGAYWHALQRFAQTVCGRPEVICGTYTLLADFMDAVPAAEIQRFQASDF